MKLDEKISVSLEPLHNLAAGSQDHTHIVVFGASEHIQQKARERPGFVHRRGTLSSLIALPMIFWVPPVVLSEDISNVTSK